MKLNFFGEKFKDRIFLIISFVDFIWVFSNLVGFFLFRKLLLVIEF